MRNDEWRMTMGLAAMRWVFGVCLLGLGNVIAEPARPTLPVEDRTNGRQTVAALDKVAPVALACSARIESLLGL